jgi:flagellar basal-body rod modification protein FlgD
MSSISALTTTSSASTSSSSSSSSSSTLSSDDFLQLLVEEMQNQNPLDADSTTDYMNQMMQYATYSQLSDMNSTLLSLQESVDTITSATVSAT